VAALQGESAGHKRDLGWMRQPGTGLS
jgi:hypothetical protein